MNKLAFHLNSFNQYSFFVKAKDEPEPAANMSDISKHFRFDVQSARAGPSRLENGVGKYRGRADCGEKVEHLKVAGVWLRKEALNKGKPLPSRG